ncbi:MULTISPECIES: hypothetical protein [unclassified Streptomyces]|uniref:hypothetical protein n=1 Tax=unclassified Streptomyces TaxID=2593676 RepID=UPI000BAC6EF6|nr:MULTISPECIES: hypothetical protein [unclassified Streptomyces]ASY31271.1 hypothetical protein CAC01_00070 [Streptomyces sp. CLI2509]ASY36469.1 hypothetical protein CAC01_30395 [Streptomyces sp. CLI2509]ASY36970.1 hypothetical protein CAC01_30475 [Streptomyces sp. CLI2509]ASY37085.1 hypothetical protein CAC01_31150 [Streptomyces sp. CLI2509]MYX22042.1 hypothetical protein [Streptomyces sp. SID8380]
MKNSFDELADDTDELAARAAAAADELAEALAAAERIKPIARQSRAARKAIPSTVVRETVAAMQAEGQKITGPTLAERLGCSARSEYRYLGEVQAA